MANTLKERLTNGETLIGSLVTLPSPDIAEIMSLVGFDYLWIDTEHSAMGFTHAQMMIQAVGGRCPCIVRVPENDPVWLKKALDTGCDGIVVPQVNSAQEAKKAIDHCLYPPLGQRSVGVSRAQDYGMSFDEYVRKANEALTIVLQVEHIEGVQNIEAIVAVPGIDAILIGPFDLSGSLGVLGQITHPEVKDAMDKVRHICEKSDVPLGVFAVDPNSAKSLIAEGYHLIALSMDSFYLWQSARKALSDVRNR
jgi:2-dehydro-3-deoxyglucarate aldolase/4-hydroxy-2-oxoheptanedioate aldolase